MFGFVTASLDELNEEQKKRYQAVYCGICRAIRQQDGQLCRLGLQYDMAFLALLLMSLYEPEETAGDRACVLHPVKPKPWVDNEYVRYAARMNVALACYNFRDNWEDEHKLTSKALASVFGKHEPQIAEEYPRQCAAIADSIVRLRQLEKENSANPDECANTMGQMMAELMVYREDLWAPTLRSLGFALGRFIYLADAAIDYRRDLKKGNYNPFVAMGQGADFDKWEQYLVLAMAACTGCYERLPLVQDKALLDNILYGGVWLRFRAEQKREQEGGSK